MPQNREAARFRAKAARERQVAQEAIARAELWERTASEIEALHRREHHRTVSSNIPMTGAHATAISKAKAGKDPFVAALNLRGYSIRSLAAALGVSQATLQAHRQPRTSANARPIPAVRAKKVAELTGWPADAASWPAGLGS